MLFLSLALIVDGEFARFLTLFQFLKNLNDMPVIRWIVVHK